MAQLKGHAVIELTDVNTGEVERVEHDNLITNGAQKLLDHFISAYGRSANSAILPIEERLLCGIYLFDDTLTESADNVLLPDVANTKLTGYAGNATSDGNDNKRGDFNSAESEALVNGYKFVWDFGTDDANGTIASLALTNYIGGFHGYNINFRLAGSSLQSNTGNGRSSYKGFGINHTLYTYPGNATLGNYNLTNIASYDGDILTTINKTSSTNITIKKYRIANKTVRMGYYVGSAELIETRDITYSDSNQNSTNTRFLDGGDGYYYGLYAGSTAGTWSLSISKINKSTLAYTAATVYSISASALGVRFPALGAITGFTANAYTDAVIRNGYVYVYYGITQYTGNGTYGIAKFPLSDPTAISKVPNTEKAFTTLGSNETVFYFLLVNGNIYTSVGVIGSDDSVVAYSDDFDSSYGSSYWGYLPIVTNGEHIIAGTHSNNGGETYFYGMFMNLESINNLDSAVTKTSAKTMKITYTLTYAS